LKGAALRYGWETDTMDVIEDHVHVFVSFPPAVSISESGKMFKGVSQRRLTEEFPDIKKRIWAAPL